MFITPTEANDRILGQGEAALIDLREPGPFSEGHPLFAVPCPFSALEAKIGTLVPRRDAPVMLLDAGEGIARDAAAALAAMGYGDLSIVAGGVTAWAAAGLTLYKGVHVPSKTLGELAELALHPRPIAPDTLAQWQAEGRDIVFCDTRPAEEHAKMTVPGATCLPNGELAHRIDSLPPGKPVVLTCAGRTRGIVGAASLSLVDPTREVWWLEDGTQGWRLAGHDLVRDASPAPLPPCDARATRDRAEAFVARHGLSVISAGDLAVLRADAGRTTFVFDVRDPSETAADPLACARPAPVVTLVQASDQFIGLRRARVVLVDDAGLRGALAAYWLRALGHEVAVCKIDDALRGAPAPDWPRHEAPPVQHLSAEAARDRVAEGRGVFVDLRSSGAHQAATVTGAVWTHRALLSRLPPDRAPCLIGAEGPEAELAAKTLMAQGRGDVALVAGGLDALRAAGVPVGPGRKIALSEAVDIVSFAHGRHDGDADASRLYLSWEKGLVDQLSPAERAQFGL